MRRQTVAVRGDYGVLDNGCDIAVVGSFGAEIGCYRLRLAGFSGCNGSRETPGHEAEGEQQRQQPVEKQALANSPWW